MALRLGTSLVVPALQPFQATVRKELYKIAVGFVSGRLEAGPSTAPGSNTRLRDGGSDRAQERLCFYAGGFRSLAVLAHAWHQAVLALAAPQTQEDEASDWANATAFRTCNHATKG